MAWGGIGGVVGFLASLLGPLGGIIAAGFVGVACGRRAAAASDEATPGGGAIAGLVGGAVAAPVFAVGAATGAVIAIRRVGSETAAASLQEMVGTDISPEQAWQLYLLSLLLAALIQVFLLAMAAIAAGALALRK
jgi:hypothetical protein